jgi:hypothetical protein
MGYYDKLLKKNPSDAQIYLWIREDSIWLTDYVMRDGYSYDEIIKYTRDLIKCCNVLLDRYPELTVEEIETFITLQD